MRAICIITQSVYDSDPRVRRKSEALIASGYTVDVLSLRAPEGKGLYSVDGVNVRAISLGKQRGSLFRYAYEYAVFFLWACIRVTIQMRRRRYAVVDVNSLPDFLVFAAIFTKWMGAKVVLDMHEIAPEFYMSKYMIEENSKAVQLIKYLERVSFNFADHVITINDPIQDLLCGRGLKSSKTTVIMNAADDSRFTIPADTADGQVEKAGDKFVMMYHGTLTKLYGLDIAIDAFALVHRDMPDAEMWILGSGPETDALSELVRAQGLTSRVRLLGEVPATMIPGWLSQCDVGILALRRDVFIDFAFPNKLPEFIIMGKTAIVTGLKAIRHYFSDKALLYFEPNNAVDLSRQMLRLYKSRELRRQLADQARAEYMPIRWSVMKERYLKMMSALSGDAHNGIAEGELPVVESTVQRG